MQQRIHMRSNNLDALVDPAIGVSAPEASNTTAIYTFTMVRPNLLLSQSITSAARLSVSSSIETGKPARCLASENGLPR